ncbi:phosphate ABC transporter permease PstA [Salinispirillum sp. LH 10-3-1]|uniref:Phosphate transport system permease protein PstA n=1 Tax=Salinispirillum sp. LH 10-3-1 TaxID=2952525 RepID=A0AB38YF67_9GAMM
MREWFRSGTPWIWLTGGALALSLIMVVGLLSLIAVRGFGHFWPAKVAEAEVVDLATGARSMVLGEITRTETVPAAVAREGGQMVAEQLDLVNRVLFKRGNRDQFGQDFVWHLEPNLTELRFPPEVLAIERREWGNFYGYPIAMEFDGERIVADDPRFYDAVQEATARSLELRTEIRRIERGEIGRISRDIENIRLEERSVELRGVSGMELAVAQERFASERARLEEEFLTLRNRLDGLYASQRRDSLQMRMSDDRELTIGFNNVVRVTRPNDITVFAKIVEYFDRLWEFLTEDPREANTEGGIFPAIFGTVTMVLIMSVMVTPFGVLAAIYLREYAKQGTITRIVRVSVYNLAGVPSIVFGVFGLGFFVYFLGGNIDQIFFPEALPAPTFGTPGLFWASLTLALLTLPVVIVSTEEGLARIPSTIRQGSLALGATKSETLWKVVVPLATPAMMTGLILAIARAAGEVAPLMLVGVVKLAPTLPIDGEFPFIHLERKIMHLGFHIYDVGFQSPNVEAARPLVYATALTLVALIVLLNLTAIAIRNRLRERYRSEGD